MMVLMCEVLHLTGLHLRTSFRFSSFFFFFFFLVVKFHPVTYAG